MAVFQHPFASHRVFIHRSTSSMASTPTTQTSQEAGLEPVLVSRTGLLVRRSHLGHLIRIRDQRGISPHAGEGRGFYPSMAPLVPAPGVKALGWWVSAPSHFPPRPLQGRLHPFGMRRGPPRAHFPPGPSRLDPGGFRPVAALGETVRTVFCRYPVSVMGAVGLSESS
jgi:hypothetical protein